MVDVPNHPAYDFFATCPRNTEGILLDELRGLGAGTARETRAGVTFHGALELAYRTCLWSRVASHVLLRLTSFAVGEIEDIYGAVREIPWEDHLDPNGTIAVETTTTIRQGPLAQINTHFIEQRTKDAIVDRFRDLTGVRPSVELARPDLRVNVHLSPEGATISIDLSGDGLHKRGYRTEAGEAPLKENLAAAILIRAGWPEVASRGGSLVDPLCGSGTFLVEAALMAADMAPGLQRTYYGFLRWSGFDPALWQELLVEARARRDVGLARLPFIYGSDSDRRAVAAASANIRRAGLIGRVAVEQRDLGSLTAPSQRNRPAPTGLLITNPPYGKRLGEVSELVGLYEGLGTKLKESFSGWRAAVFTGNPELGAHLGLRADRVNTFYNGPILCKLLSFSIGEGFDRRPPDLPSRGSTMFANRLLKNFKHLRKWAAREGVTCYRVYDADLPEYSAAIDLYNDWAHVQEYAPPPSVDPVVARRRIREVLRVVPETLGIPSEQVVLKVRRPQRGREQYERLQRTGRDLEATEGGLRFLVNLTDYLDTGLFLDHRPTRALLMELAAGRRFLNLFAYTGSATVYAAAGGALSTTSVDLSQTYLDWAGRNLALNGLLDARHHLVRADCLDWVARAGGGAYDLIFLDAPTFSNSKSMQGTLDIQRDHPVLIREVARLLASGGILIFSTNFRRFKMSQDVLREFNGVDITQRTIPPDFARSPRIHSCFRLAARDDV